jgi:RNA polymerase sigma factor (TIGR02999 family)
MAADATPRARVTDLLVAWGGGRRDAFDELLPLVYGELRRVAAGQLRRESGGHILQPTALVHEAYLRLVDQRRVRWRNRAQFYGIAAQLMRRVLVDHARAQASAKRGGAVKCVPFVEDEVPGESPGVDVAALDEALGRLAAFDERQARIVELRFFGGLTIEEAAEVLGLSDATVVREWTVARAWLRSELE